MKILEEKCSNFNYDIRKNSYYEIVEKYRNLNNSIKHGKIYNSIKKKYPKLINDEDGIIK